MQSDASTGCVSSYCYVLQTAFVPSQVPISALIDAFLHLKLCAMCHVAGYADAELQHLLSERMHLQWLNSEGTLSTQDWASSLSDAWNGALVVFVLHDSQDFVAQLQLAQLAQLLR